MLVLAEAEVGDAMGSFMAVTEVGEMMVVAIRNRLNDFMVVC